MMDPDPTRDPPTPIVSPENDRSMAETFVSRGPLGAMPGPDYLSCPPDPVYPRAIPPRIRGRIRDRECFAELEWSEFVAAAQREGML